MHKSWWVCFKWTASLHWINFGHLAWFIIFCLSLMAVPVGLALTSFPVYDLFHEQRIDT